MGYIQLFFPCCANTNDGVKAQNWRSSYVTHLISAVATSIIIGLAAALAAYFLTQGVVMWTAVAGASAALLTFIIFYVAQRCLCGQTKTNTTTRVPPVTTSPPITNTVLGTATPPQSTNRTHVDPLPQEKKSQYGEKVGVAEITIDSKKTPISIVEKMENDLTLYGAVQENDKLLGYITFTEVTYDTEKKKLTSPYLSIIAGDMRKYDEELKGSSKVGRIYINYIEAYKKGCGLGGVLMQAAIEKSILLGHEGRIQLSAAWESHAFYYKLGLRSYDDDRNKQIEEELEKAEAEKREPNTKKLGSFFMYLPQKSLPEWQEKIRKHPYLTALS
jgi:predicted GNAT family N-acyltransferase